MNVEHNLISGNVISSIEDEIDKFSSEPDDLVKKLEYRTSILLCNMCTMYNTFMDHMGRQYQIISELKLEIENLKNELDKTKIANKNLEQQLNVKTYTKN